MRYFFLAMTVIVAFSSCKSSRTNMQQTKVIDWQGHRGARGLAPENTIPSFLKALEYPEITTLELDVAISADSLVVISHEPWFSDVISSHPDGSPVQEAEAKSLNLYRMNYAEIQRYDCGQRGHKHYPEQQKQAAVKPLLSDMIKAVDEACRQQKRPLVRYNIEIKSQRAWDGIYTPVPEDFARLVLEVIDEAGIRKRCCVQSFDKRPLQAMHRLAPELTIALLIESMSGVSEQLAELGFTPQVYSPHYQMVTAHLVEAVHAAGMRIIPWTVNETNIMTSLLSLGVDGISTDYPDRIPR